MIVLFGLLVSPLLALANALLRALILFWPFMIVVGALHSHVPGIPPISYLTSFFLIAAVALLIPTSNSKG